MSHRCRRSVAALGLFATPCLLGAQTLMGTDLQVRVDLQNAREQEVLAIRVNGNWASALTAASTVHVLTDTGMHVCQLLQTSAVQGDLLLTGDCGVGTYQQRIALTAERDVVDVSTRLLLKQGASVRSVEDRYDFVPPRHPKPDEHTGALDFVWSQNIKSEADDLIPINGFKSPTVMLQQGSVFAAIMPHLSDHHVETLALDLDVSSSSKPWVAFGAIPSTPHGHSYFRRNTQADLKPINNTVEYTYSLVLSQQAYRLGYRRVVARLWQQLGHPALLNSPELQRNTLRPELSSFDSWRQDAWHTYADRVYTGFRCGQQECGTLASNRSYTGDWQQSEPDAWFNAWFQTLRTAYGWYVHGREIKDPEMMAKAESVLTLALSSPRHGGAFSTIYLLKSQKWVVGDGWASYANSYHAFSLSWTAYWMLRWAEDLTPSRKAEILQFVKPYGDFLLAHQRADGLIPSWYVATSMEPRTEFRDFNAETPPSALFLVELGKVSGDASYTASAERAMSFVTREVVPRQRWYDFETFRSCARKDYSFYDSWTEQYPQNNLAEIQAPEAMLALFEATHKQEYLDRGTEMLDYVLLTQQVWNNPLFTPSLLGGFTTQNTDAEWSDARQGYAAVVLADYYQATGKTEYLERAVAAARSTFAVAPWENWAHTGYLDEPGALTGFHWGTGSAMATVELLSPTLGDALIDLPMRQGVGFDECTIRDVDIQGDNIHFTIESAAKQRPFLIRFRGVQPSRTYHIRWNNSPEETISGEQLSQHGLRIRLLG